MAAAANHATSNHSPRNSGDGSSLNSPQSKRLAAARGVSSPWTQVVRGSESELIPSAAVPSCPLSPDLSPSKGATAVSYPSSAYAADDSAVEAQPESSDNGSGSSNASKKPAWNKPSNGAVDVGPVMDAMSWPALSESTRAPSKLSSSDSLKGVSDGSIPVLQGTGTASSTSQKQIITTSINASSSPDHVALSRQKPMKRGGGNSSGSITANGGFSQPPPSPQGSVVENSTNAGKPGSAVVESSPSRDHAHKESGRRGGFGSQSHSNHPQQHNSFRRGNVGPHPRGDGSYHHNHGGRRDQERGNRGWNPHQSFNGRDTPMQPRRVFPGGFVRPLPHGAPFIPPPPMHVRPFGSPMVYPEVASPVIYVPAPAPESIRGVPIVAPMAPHAVYFPVPDPQVHSKIVSQIDYYFSNENLIKDTFLRQNMDEQGWVPVKLIASFKKVMLLTDNIQLILDALRSSTTVEVQGDKVRRRNDWSRWIMPPSVQFTSVSSPGSFGRSSPDMLTAHLQSVSLEEKISKLGQVEALPSRSSSGDSSSLSQPSIAEGTDQAALATVQVGSECVSARSK